MPRIRQKNCHRCNAEVPVLYRVKVDDSGAWQFVCDRCWPIIQQNNPHYVYGGTWKARKRH